MGQGTCNTEQAEKLGEIFGLSEAEKRWLQVVPTRNGPERVPNDPLLYRLHEVRTLREEIDIGTTGKSRKFPTR